MTKPTCKTCQHWNEDWPHKLNETNPELRQGLCKQRSSNFLNYFLFLTLENDSCELHRHFPLTN